MGKKNPFPTRNPPKKTGNGEIKIYSKVKNKKSLDVPSQLEIDELIKFYQIGHYEISENLAKSLLLKYPNHPFCWTVLSAILKQVGRLEESLNAMERAVEIEPKDAAAHNNLGVMYRGLGRLEAAELSYKTAITINFNLFEAHSNLANTLRELGRLGEAEVSCRKAIFINPNYADAHNNLSIILKESGRLSEAETSCRKAISINPDYADAHNNLGLILEKNNRPEKSLESFNLAIILKPDCAEFHYNLGITLQKLGILSQAESSYKSAIKLNKDFFEAYFNLGTILQHLGKNKEAEIIYKSAINLNPENEKAHYNLGIAFQEQDKVEEAERSFRRAISINLENSEAHYNLAFTLFLLGKDREALVALTKSFQIESTSKSKILFVELAKKISVKTWNELLGQLTTSALIEPWARPLDLMPLACSLLKANGQFKEFLDQLVQIDSQSILNKMYSSKFLTEESTVASLFYAALASGPITDNEIEAKLVNLRSYFLQWALTISLNDNHKYDFIKLHCLIAQQCFINEYVYVQTKEEHAKAIELINKIEEALKFDHFIPAICLVTVACYFPLYTIPKIEKIIHQNWPDDIYSILRQQVEEPLNEFRVRQSIPVLTRIENQVSLEVQTQYEKNPYPRWVRLPKESSGTILNSYILSKFALSSFKPILNNSNPEILIAGCGTGQHPIGISKLILGSRILAVDLSIASLAYAKRKTFEIGIQSINYAQADILNLASIGRTFDVVDASGVLHHLDDPLEGFRVLLSLLRPHGLMRLGLYSELARRDIVKVRNLISKEAIGSTPQEIRDFRKYLIELKNSEDYGFATSSSDFYSTSSCRDLLFNVQEHHMNLGIISKFLNDHDLNFLGFEIGRHVIQSYKNRFLNDTSATNLDQWRIYENENPNTFIGMYQFWIQKNH
jgi:tetratricopeptide (TPR) repeat protein